MDVRSTCIRLVSSMATRRVLAELIIQAERTLSLRVSSEAVGGVEAAKRVRNGDVFDAVVLASDVIDRLIAEQHILPASRIDLATSPIAIAVPAGAPHPDIGSAAAVKDAVLAARRVSYSTGPSGTYLAKLFAGWGPEDVLKDRITVAPPGVPVGTLVARGDVDLGFQQLSELIGVDGIAVVGLLPADLQLVTVFSGGVARTSEHPGTTRELLEFMARPALSDVKRRHGMEPASSS